MKLSKEHEELKQSAKQLKATQQQLLAANKTASAREAAPGPAERAFPSCGVE